MEEMVDQVVVDHLKVIQPLLLVDKVVVVEHTLETTLVQGQVAVELVEMVKVNKAITMREMEVLVVQVK